MVSCCLSLKENFNFKTPIFLVVYDLHFSLMNYLIEMLTAYNIYGSFLHSIYGTQLQKILFTYSFQNFTSKKHLR